MSPGSTSPAPSRLSEQDEQRLRDAVTDAVLSGPSGLREAMGTDPGAALVLVEASRVAAEETSRLLQESVAHARAAGHSWDTIGRLIGVSRQAAQQRFGPPGPPGPVSDRAAGTPARRVLSPLTVFDEMAVLEREGRRGWHVVDYGTLFHVVEASDHVWEHRRAAWTPRAARELAEDGWVLVGGWSFPWGYWKRRLDVPAEPEPGAGAGGDPGRG